MMKTTKQQEIGRKEKEEEIKRLIKSKDRLKQLERLIDLDKIAIGLKKLYPKKGAPSIEVEKSLRILVVQYIQDVSDRQMEDLLIDSLRTKYFCKYTLEEKTPDHSHLGKFRKRLGVENIQKIFDEINSQLSQYGLIGNMFSFIDASSLKAKEQLWKERDEALVNKEKVLNNTVVGKYGKDKEARFGSKGKNKYWYGYKRHVEVDMKKGIIVKVTATPANEADKKGIEIIRPEGKIVYMDKGYDYKDTDELLEELGSEPATIRRKNSKKKR